ncbi:phospholipid methyltransferase-domain-containing protein, partial [Chytriomyces cf. hyalinus JEL632]
SVFPIPPVNSLVHSLLFPACIFDWTILTLIAANLVLLLLFGTPKTMFLALFVAWRIAYNLAIGILLRLQCDYNWLTRLAKKYGFAPNAGKKRGQWQSYLVAEVMKKLDLDEAEFNASNLPVEFTTWILFRALVDCVLVNDFMSHTLFSIAYFKAPTHDGVGPEIFGIGWKDWLRYSVGCVLLLVNYGIKIEGNRAVSDYAWYWGDFFFFQTNESPPAAAFELAPHPMYSVGYVGFYAAALIAKSYTVFFVSLVAHLAQIGFFFFVESHHFERTYGPPGADSNLTENLQSLFRRDLLMFKNFDLFRSTDVLTMLVWILTLINACIVGRTCGLNLLDTRQALFWRFIYSGVLGYVLHLQSKYTFWSRHFIKFGETAFDAFRHWKIIYNLCQSMTYISFFLCAFMLYKLPSDWLVGTVMLKHTIALILILLHIWTTFSIHKTLGEYGWFFGDFFIDSPTYTGLYRFLNHPNAWAAAASAWGVTVVTGSPHVLLVTIISQICGWCFVFLVEAPHMRRRYGNLLRSQSLVDEILPVSGSTGSFGEGYQEFAYVRNVRGSLTSMRGLRRRIGGGSGALGSRRVMGGTSDGAGGSPLRSNSSTGSFSRVAEWREQMRLHSMTFQLGAPITIQFQCVRETLKRRDWIGIYPVGDNLSTEVTTSKSFSRWIRATTSSLTTEQNLLFGNTVVKVRPSDEDQGLRIVTGTLLFRRSKIPWQVGKYEARYQYDGGYSVVTISQPFEIVAECFQWVDVAAEDVENEIDRIEDFLLGYVELNQFRKYKENVAKRIVYGIKRIFGIEFSWHVVGFAGTVKHLARRVSSSFALYYSHLGQ